MTILGGAQQTLTVSGPDAPDGKKGGADKLGEAREAAPTRSSFTAPSGAHQLVSRTSPARRRDLAGPEHAVLVGDPVNVATGAVVTAATDLNAVGGVEVRRHYRSDHSDRSGPLGYGWGHSLDQAVWLERGRVVMRNADGREIEFDTMELQGQVARAGDQLHDPTGRFQLRCMGQFRWALEDDDGVLQFTPVPGEDVRERDRGMSRLTRIARSGRRIVELAYDKEARLGEILVEGRTSITFDYDDGDRICGVWVRSPEGMRRQASFEYEPSGDLTTSTDALGRTRKYEYKGHLLVRETNPVGASFFYGYDAQGSSAKCVRTWGSGGHLDRQLEYAGSTTTVIDSRGSVTTYGCDARGLVTSIGNSLGDVTRYAYDDALRLIQVRYPDGTSATQSYDDAGRLIKHRSRGGAVWRMRYNPQTGRLLERVGPGEARFAFDYDGAGRLTKVEDACGHTTRFEYVDRQLREIIDPLGQRTTLSLTSDGDVESVALPGQMPTRFEYDAHGRLSCAHSREGHRAAWEYDLDGDLAGVFAGDESIRFERDAAGHVVHVDAGAHSIRAKRDVFGQILALSDGDTAIAYAYDKEGSLVEVTRCGATALSLRRESRGLVESYAHAEGEPWIVLRKPNTALVERFVRSDQTVHVEWDAAGRIVAVTAEGGVAKFEYRDDGLLVGAHNAESNCSISRDPLGGVLSQVAGEHTLVSSPLDFRGRRLGLELEGGPHLSFLRGATGDLARFVVSQNDRVFDIRIEAGPGGRHTLASCDEASLEIHRDAWGRMTKAQMHPGDETAAWSWPAPPDELPANSGERLQCDALHRPLRNDGGAIVWDQDRVFARGDDLFVSDPDRGEAVAWVTDGELQFVLPEAGGLDRPLWRDTEAARQYTACFPSLGLRGGIEQVCPTPLELIEHAFRYQAWNPDVRPIPGDHPWNPDLWRPVLDAPRPPDGRLTQQALLRIFGGSEPPVLSVEGGETR